MTIEAGSPQAMADGILKFAQMDPAEYETYCHNATETVKEYDFGYLTDRLEEILKERLQTAERIKHDVEAWLNMIPQRMQRIIRYKIFEELTWSEVAVRMGRKATADGVRMEYTNFMKEK